MESITEVGQRKAKLIPLILLLITTIIVVIHDTKSVMLVVSNSMEPEIKVNTLIFVRRESIENIAVGDIICFKNTSGKNIVHRVVSINNNDNKEVFIYTKGDNNKDTDNSVVTKANYIGKVGISIWLNDIVLEVLPFVFAAGLTFIGVVYKWYTRHFGRK